MEVIVLFGFTNLSVAAKTALVNQDFHEVIQTDKTTYRCVIDPCAPAVFGEYKLSQCIGTNNQYYTNGHMKIFNTADIQDWIDEIIEKGQCPSCQAPLKKRKHQFYGCSNYKVPRPEWGCVTKLFSPRYCKFSKRRRVNTIKKK